MVHEKDRLKIIELARKYKVNRVFLFGSSIDANKESHDIDLAIDGIQDSMFFKFYGDLIFNLSKPVDVIDLKRKTRLNDLVKSEGILIYGYPEG